MAQRGEGQGLQIAVISFAILAIVLAGMSFFFFSSAKTAQKDLEAKNKTVMDQQKQINLLMYKVDAMSYVLGVDSKTLQDVDVSKSKAGGDDAKVKEVLDTFASDVAHSYANDGTEPARFSLAVFEPGVGAASTAEASHD